MDKKDTASSTRQARKERLKKQLATLLSALEQIELEEAREHTQTLRASLERERQETKEHVQKLLASMKGKAFALPRRRGYVFLVTDTRLERLSDTEFRYCLHCNNIQAEDAGYLRYFKSVDRGDFDTKVPELLTIARPICTTKFKALWELLEKAEEQATALKQE